MKRLRILTLVALILAGSIHYFKSTLKNNVTTASTQSIPKNWFKSEGEIETPKEYRRLADQTYLTYPEWFLVYSPEEQAEFLKNNTATDFSYLNEMDKFWDSYAIISQQIEGKYPYNEEYNTMINIIGISTAVEYNLRAWYEMVIGRMTNVSIQTEEDVFTQNHTQKYVNSLHEYAWYEFDFMNELNVLWTETSFFGANFHRKLERKYVLTSELVLKALYAKIMKMGSQNMYGDIPTTTVIVTDKLTPNMKKNTDIKVLESLNNGNYILSIPRYTAFKNTVFTFINDDVNITEIAGNKSAILVSIILNKNEEIQQGDICELFTQDLSTNSEFKRVVLATPIINLMPLLKYCQSNSITVEHVYDF